MNPVYILNFSNIYTSESFYKNDNYKLYDLTDLNSVRYLCQKESYDILEKRLSDIPFKAIHFIDSGDYHYLTKLFTDKIDIDYNLVIFDHHSDNKIDSCKDILNCGNWINFLSKKHLKKIIQIGPDTKSGRIININEEEMIEFERKNLSFMYNDYPVYISIDKDILSKVSCNTDWDQGTITEEELLEGINRIIENSKVIGIDICGEMNPSDINPIDYYKDDKINGDLIEEIVKEAKK